MVPRLLQSFTRLKVVIDPICADLIKCPETRLSVLGELIDMVWDEELR